MSGKGGGGNSAVGKGSAGISAIPASSRKMVQSLREIVNCPDLEIYAMLKECNMDPNEAVNRLLAQDPFHEVKSKRDKKKENKDTVDSRPRVGNNMTNHSGRGGTDRYAGRGGSTHYAANETGPLHGKPAYGRENGTNSYAGYLSYACGAPGNNMIQRLPSYSQSAVTENKIRTAGHLGDGISSSSQLPSGYQSAFFGVPGQVSMADMVKMGRPQNKGSIPANLHPSHEHVVNVADNEREVPKGQHLSTNDEWPPIETPSAPSMPSVLDAPPDSEIHANSLSLHLDGYSQHVKSHVEEAEAADDGPLEVLDTDDVRPLYESSRNTQEDDSRGSSLFDDNLYKDMNAYQPQSHAFEHPDAEYDASSVTANMLQLSLQDNEGGAAPEQDVPSVIIPNHLQVHTPECAHLSFGSFGSAFLGPFAARPLKNDLVETSEVDASLNKHSDNRDDYYDDENVRSTTDIINNISAGNYESTSESHSEVLKPETPETAQDQYAFPSSATSYSYENTKQLDPTYMRAQTSPSYSYENTQQLDPAYTHPRTSSQVHHLSPLSSVMQPYTNSLPSALLSSSVQTARVLDLPYSPFPVTQSMSTKYGNTASAITGPNISMAEALKAASIPAQQQSPQTLLGANVATGPALPQHLTMHPYSQPTLPLGHFTNMIGYPFLAQSYAYMPSAFQQSFAGNSTYPQSLAAGVPQYKNSVAVSSLPQSAAVASGYGFGSSTSTPGGNFPLNPPTAPSGTTIGYDDVLSSQFKDTNHLMSLQQNENSALWLHGAGTRTMSAIPASTYYSFQGQNQQPGGFRQAQQPSQHFGALGYPNFYHSQTGMALDHQRQNPRDGSLGGGQGQASKQTQQLWQNSY